jgi:type IV secretory pathway protease TraF
MFWNLIDHIPTKTILFIILLFLLQQRLIYSVSDSATPAGLYAVHGDTQIKAEDLVLLRMPIKEVAALPGQRVTFTPEGVYVQGKGLIPNSAPEPGIPRVCPFGSYTVPPYMFLGLGTRDPDSWDGRYACFLPQSLIRGTISPILTEDK